MTRINAGVQVDLLCDEHLKAEHREIVRLRHLIGKSYLSAPKEFKLGTGHVVFFADKLVYIKERYEQLEVECLRRGFNRQYYADAFNGVVHSKKWDNDFEGFGKIKTRIIERLIGMSKIHYFGVKVNANDMIELIDTCTCYNTPNKSYCKLHTEKRHNELSLFKKLAKAHMP